MGLKVRAKRCTTSHDIPPALRETAETFAEAITELVAEHNYTKPLGTLYAEADEMKHRIFSEADLHYWLGFLQATGDVISVCPKVLLESLAKEG